MQIRYLEFQFAIGQWLKLSEFLVDTFQGSLISNKIYGIWSLLIIKSKKELLYCFCDTNDRKLYEIQLLIDIAAVLKFREAITLRSFLRYIFERSPDNSTRVIYDEFPMKRSAIYYLNILRQNWELIKWTRYPLKLKYNIY